MDDADQEVSWAVGARLVSWARRDQHLPMWAVTENPRDYPDKWVARLWLVMEGEHKATNKIVVRSSRALIEAVMQDMGLTKIDRSPEDEPHLRGTWL